MALLVTLILLAFAYWLYDYIKIPKKYRSNIISPIEKRMYKALRREGYEPIPQYPICGYRLDFAIIKDNIKLDIECDGVDSHSSPKQKEHDRKRTRVLNKAGWNVIRFSGKQIYRDIDRCIERINCKINNSNEKSLMPEILSLKLTVKSGKTATKKGIRLLKSLIKI